MNRIDVNSLIGHWPFRKLYKNTFEDLKSAHRENDIDYGYVASLDSIFYNDPFEGDEDLHKILEGSKYKHVLTINPLLPSFEYDIERGIEKFDIKGVRVYPTYHGYNLDNENFLRLCSILKKYDLPLFLPLRMEDIRMNHLIRPQNLALYDLQAFLIDHMDNTVVLLTAYSAEIAGLKDLINESPNFFFDTSGLKDGLFKIESLLVDFIPEKILYGSLYPLYTMKSTKLLIDWADISQDIEDRILDDSLL